MTREAGFAAQQFYLGSALAGLPICAKLVDIAGGRSTADAIYAGAFGMFMNSPMLGAHRTPQLEAYVARCKARPARARAMAKETPSA